MSDHIARDREEHRDHRRDKRWEKEDQPEEDKELDHDPEDRIVEESIDLYISHHEHSDEDDRLERYHHEHHRTKSDEFPEDDTRSSNRLREHEIDRTTLDLSSDHPSPEKKYYRESCELDKWETEIIEHPLDLTKCEGLEGKCDKDKYHSEKEDEGEKLISHEFSDGVLSDSEHMMEFEIELISSLF